jgi:membrane-associated phospholipid phosphatase
VKFLLIMLGLCLLFSLLLSLAVVDDDNPLTRFDHDAVNTLHDHTTSTGTHLFELVTWFGSPGPWFVGLGCLAYLVGRARWADLLTGAALIGGGKLLNVLLKELFDRPRPVFATDSSPAFPSGHAMMALLTYGFLAILLWSAAQPPGARCDPHRDGGAGRADRFQPRVRGCPLPDRHPRRLCDGRRVAQSVLAR